MKRCKLVIRCYITLLGLLNILFQPLQAADNQKKSSFDSLAYFKAQAQNDTLPISDKLTYIEAALPIAYRLQLKEDDNAYDYAALMVRRAYLLFSNADYAESLSANDSAIDFIAAHLQKYPHLSNSTLNPNYPADDEAYEHADNDADANKSTSNAADNNKNNGHTQKPGALSRFFHKVSKSFGHTSATFQPTPWDRLYMEALANKGLTLVYCNRSNLAGETFLTILDLYGQSADSNNIAIAKSFNGMGITFANRNQHDVALPYFRRSLEIYEHLDDQRGIYLLNSNIGACYLNQGLYREALPYLYKVQEVVLKEHYNGDEPIYANSQLGLAYQGFGDYTLAEHFFKEALQVANQKKYNHLRPFLNNLYAKNLIKQKRYAEAESLGRQTRLELSRRQGSESLDIEALAILSEAMAARGNYTAAYDYLNERSRKMEALEKRLHLEALSQQKYEFDHYRQEQKRAFERRNMELVQAKIHYRNIAIALLILCLIGIGIGLVYLWKRYKAQHTAGIELSQHLQTQNELDQKRLESMEAHYNSQIDDKNKELASNALQFLRLSKMAGDISEKSKQLKINSSLRGKEKVLLIEIEQLAEQMGAENKGWNEFTFYFEQVDKDFLKNLSEKYPTLTPKEKQYCILFSLNLSNKDIANLTGKTLQSVGMAKYRLKEKMGLAGEEDIAGVLQQL